MLKVFVLVLLFIVIRRHNTDLSGKRGKENMEKGGKWRRKEGKLQKGRWKIEMEGRKSSKMSRLPFFCFSLFKTMKICFGCTKMEIFYREKGFHAGKKKSGKITLPPQKKFPVTPLYNSTPPLQLSPQSPDLRYAKCSYLFKQRAERITFSSEVMGLMAGTSIHFKWGGGDAMGSMGEPQCSLKLLQHFRHF